MRRHVVLISPPWYPVPPVGYGGIELVVGLLSRELRARGHAVTLIAAEGTVEPATVLAPAEWSADLGGSAEPLRRATYAARLLEPLRAVRDPDVVHDHCGLSALVAAAALDIAPVVHTVHGPLTEPDATLLGSFPTTVGLVAISSAQRRSAPQLPWLGTIHNAVDSSALSIARSEEKEAYLLCLARICREKGQHLAIEVARRTGMRLVLAGKVEQTPASRAYFEELVAPHIDGVRIVHTHNVAGVEKARLLAHALALLAPLQWDEPFGLALAEAMASGTPVVALARGAAPELIVSGVTGFVAEDLDGLVYGVRIARQIDPARCAADARARFSPGAMTDAYLAAYDRAGTPAAQPQSPGSSEERLKTYAVV